ncbi:MAG: aminoglycoside phosphotransferase family protein [Clostridia bacterium]|nr:aminoglycoside phosphotransferase family protein [Clostridia bacterium]
MAYNALNVTKLFPITVRSESDLVPYGNGHINDTYLVSADEGKYIMQKINKSIFKDPVGLMNNISLVTEYIARHKENEPNYDPARVIRVIPASDGNNYAVYEGEYFRLYNFVDAISYDLSNNEILGKAGLAFGDFQNILDSFDASQLIEVIPDFHNTKKRFADFKKAVNDNLSGRAENAKKEIELALSYEKASEVVVEEMAKGTIPLRVTHNDTKLNNILFDRNTGDFVCVVDLDTIMPGSLLYDFGDALRFGASSASEDEQDLDRVYFELDKFESFARGFLSQVHTKLTKKEIELLPFSALLLTYECGIRFLGDYINGDTYFKGAFPEHNLVRARNQLKLVVDIEAKLDQMAKIVEKILSELE